MAQNMGQTIYDHQKDIFYLSYYFFERQDCFGQASGSFGWQLSLVDSTLPAVKPQQKIQQMNHHYHAFY